MPLNQSHVKRERPYDGNVCKEKKMNDQDEQIFSFNFYQSSNTSHSRSYITEGFATLTQGNHTQTRYLFLFDDWLIIVKSKANNAFQLKKKIRVAEMWITEYIHGIGDVDPESKLLSFVIGWPLINSIITFKSKDARNTWWCHLSNAIKIQCAREEPKTTTLKIFNWNLNSHIKSKTMRIGSQHTADECLKKAMKLFNFSQDDISKSKINISTNDNNFPEINNQEIHLWVQIQNSSIMLIGHERPYAIITNHVTRAMLLDRNVLSVDKKVTPLLPPFNEISYIFHDDLGKDVETESVRDAAIEGASNNMEENIKDDSTIYTRKLNRLIHAEKTKELISNEISFNENTIPFQSLKAEKNILDFNLKTYNSPPSSALSPFQLQQLLEGNTSTSDCQFSLRINTMTQSNNHTKVWYPNNKFLSLKIKQSKLISTKSKNGIYRLKKSSNKISNLLIPRISGRHSSLKHFVDQKCASRTICNPCETISPLVVILQNTEFDNKKMVLDNLSNKSVIPSIQGLTNFNMIRPMQLSYENKHGVGQGHENYCNTSTAERSDDKTFKDRRKSKLFNKHLNEIMISNNEFPKPIKKILQLLYTYGPYTIGIFRKSASAKLCKTLKEQLDRGTDVNLDDVPMLAISSIFKEFLRNIPNGLMDCHLYEKWHRIMSIENEHEKFTKCKGLYSQLPSHNRFLLAHTLKIFKLINDNSVYNSMTSANMSICVGPSLLWEQSSASISNPCLVVGPKRSKLLHFGHINISNDSTQEGKKSFSALALVPIAFNNNNKDKDQNKNNQNVTHGFDNCNQYEDQQVMKDGTKWIPLLLEYMINNVEYLQPDSSSCTSSSFKIKFNNSSKNKHHLVQMHRNNHSRKSQNRLKRLSRANAIISAAGLKVRTDNTINCDLDNSRLKQNMDPKNFTLQDKFKEKNYGIGYENINDHRKEAIFIDNDADTFEKKYRFQSYKDHLFPESDPSMKNREINYETSESTTGGLLSSPSSALSLPISLSRLLSLPCPSQASRCRNNYNHRADFVKILLSPTTSMSLSSNEDLKNNGQSDQMSGNNYLTASNAMRELCSLDNSDERSQSRSNSYSRSNSRVRVNSFLLGDSDSLTSLPLRNIDERERYEEESSTESLEAPDHNDIYMFTTNYLPNRYYSYDNNRSKLVPPSDFLKPSRNDRCESLSTHNSELINPNRFQKISLISPLTSSSRDSGLTLSDSNLYNTEPEVDQDFPMTSKSQLGSKRKAIPARSFSLCTAKGSSDTIEKINGKNMRAKFIIENFINRNADHDTTELLNNDCMNSNDKIIHGRFILANHDGPKGMQRTKDYVNNISGTPSGKDYQQNYNRKDFKENSSKISRTHAQIKVSYLSPSKRRNLNNDPEIASILNDEHFLQNDYPIPSYQSTSTPPLYKISKYFPYNETNPLNSDIKYKNPLFSKKLEFPSCSLLGAKKEEKQEYVYFEETKEEKKLTLQTVDSYRARKVYEKSLRLYLTGSNGPKYISYHGNPKSNEIIKCDIIQNDLNRKNLTTPNDNVITSKEVIRLPSPDKTESGVKENNIFDTYSSPIRVRKLINSVYNENMVSPKINKINDRSDTTWSVLQLTKMFSNMSSTQDLVSFKTTKGIHRKPDSCVTKSLSLNCNNQIRYQL
ncbi:unnamed protein product [Gordionus sp. m RMFG-2023]